MNQRRTTYARTRSGETQSLLEAEFDPTAHCWGVAGCQQKVPLGDPLV
jgi:hypothetical protein